MKIDFKFYLTLKYLLIKSVFKNNLRKIFSFLPTFNFSQRMYPICFNAIRSLAFY